VRREPVSGIFPRTLVDRRPNRWPLRLLALAIATVTWVIVSYVPRLERQTAIAAEREVEALIFYDVASPLMLLKREHRVMVTVRGPTDTIRRLESRDVVLQVPFPDLPDIALGAPTQAVLSRENVTVPPGIEVLRLNPDRIVLLIDRRDSREMQVQARIVGEPAAGARHDFDSPESTRVTPPTVTVEGPRSRIEALQRVVAGPISLDNHALSFVERVEVRPDADGDSAGDGDDAIVVTPSLVDVCILLRQPDKPTPDPCPPR
jgi:YbbR domain-containing protein